MTEQKKEQKSAILQMLRGERGSLEELPLSKEYKKANDDYSKKFDKFYNALQKYPDLLALFEKLDKAADIERMEYFDLVYKEAFSFGLAMGREVFEE